MSIQAINAQPNAVNFGEGEKQKRSSKAGAGIVLGAVAGGAAGYAIKDPVAGSTVLGLDKDKFEKQFAKVQKGNEEVYKKLEALKNEDLKAAAETDAGKVFVDAENKAVTELSVEDYLKKIKPELNDKAGLDALIGSTEDAAEKTKLENIKTIIEKAVDNKIGKDAYAAAKEAELKATKAVAVDELLKGLGDLHPKASSGMKALKFAGIGAVALGIIGAFIKSKKPEAPTA